MADDTKGSLIASEDRDNGLSGSEAAAARTSCASLLLRCGAVMKTAVLIVCIAAPAGAASGTVYINQASALKGNVTPGDARGFPVTISRSGSYKLSGNLRVSNPRKAAINITADNVSLDLNGFTIRGPCPTREQCPFGTGVASAGVNSVGYRTRTENGNITGFYYGIASVRPGNRVENMTISESNTGILVSEGLVHNNVVIHNNLGVYAPYGIVIENLLLENDIGLYSGDKYTGYGHNVLSGNTHDIYPPFSQIGGNLCSGSPCP
jgi:hypothetical protein